MLRATGHTLKVSSCASVDGRGELRRVAQKASQNVRSAILTALRAPKTADGRHRDTVDGNQRGLRSADETWTLVDGTVNFQVRFSKVILTAPALLSRVHREGP